MTVTVSLVMDIFLAVLLIVAIVYFWRLDARLKALRSGKDGMLEAARELAQTVAHAENAISGLRQSAAESGENLQSKIDQARALSDAAEQRRSRNAPGVGPDDAAPPAGGLRRRMTY